MPEPVRAENLSTVRVLAFCGDSLLVQGIGASLLDRNDVEIALLDSSRHDVVEVLDRLGPDIIVFDLTPSQLSPVFTFLRTHTDVLLIGLDIEHGLALVLSAEWRMPPTVADLMKVIEERIQLKNGRRV